MKGKKQIRGLCMCVGMYVSCVHVYICMRFMDMDEQ